MLCLVTFHDFLPHSQTLSRKLAASGQMKCTITLIKTRNLLLVWRLWKAFGIVKVYNLTKYTTKGWFVSDISVQKCHMFTVLFVTRASLKNRVHHQVKVLEPLSHSGEIPELTWHKFAHPVWPVSRAILSHFLHILILCLFAERKQCFFFSDLLFISFFLIVRREPLPSDFLFWMQTDCEPSSWCHCHCWAKVLLITSSTQPTVIY